MKFAIGTAGWRKVYGSFPHQILQESEARDLLNAAWDLGFEFLDTAPSYGDSEELLGQIHPKQLIATKVTVNPNSLTDIEISIAQSKSKLKLDSIPLLFVHNWDSLADKLKIETAKILESHINRRNVLRWGISTYEYSELDKVGELNLKNIVVQINSNILDQRINNVSYQVKQDLKFNNIEIWARSIFLQGILLNQTIENKFIENPDIENFFEKSISLNLTPLELCLNYIRCNENIDLAILGIVSIFQLEEIGKILHKPSSQLNFDSFRSFDLDLVDPRRWSQ